MTTLSIDECRKAFEKWWGGDLECVGDEYINTATYTSWTAWQAAWDTRHEAKAEYLKVTRLNKRESAWQPIETAPKDGTKIIALDTKNRYAEDIYGGTERIQISYFIRQSDGYEYWCGFSGQFPPTHWMPYNPQLK